MAHSSSYALLQMHDTSVNQAPFRANGSHILGHLVLKTSVVR